MKKLVVLMATLLLSGSVLANDTLSCIQKYQKSSDKITRAFRTLGRIDNGSGVIYVASVFVLQAAGVATIPALVAVPLASYAASSHRDNLDTVIDLVNESHALINYNNYDVPTLTAFQAELAKKSKVELDLDIIANELIRLNDTGELCDGTASRVKRVRSAHNRHIRNKKIKNKNAMKKDLLYYFKKF